VNNITLAHERFPSPRGQLHICTVMFSASTIKVRRAGDETEPAQC